jgi:hypothetical protein
VGPDAELGGTGGADLRAETLRAGHAPRDLDWLTAILRGGAGAITSAPPRTWRVLSVAGGTTSLLPPQPRPAAAALRQFNDSMSTPERLAKVALGVALRAGGGPFLMRRRWATGAGTAALVEEELPRVLGVPRVEVAISVGATLRPNVKPVLTVLSPAGRVLAFAKIGWNELTADLVRNESRMLLELRDRPTRTFRAPRVLHHGTWNGNELLVLSPLEHAVRRRRPVDALPEAAMLRELATVMGSERVRVTSTPVWADLVARATAAAGTLEHGERVAAAIAALEARLADVELLHGLSHGDFAPWNLLHTASGVNLWDWERAAPSRPVGFDVVHYAFEVAHRRAKQAVPAALATATRRAARAAPALGIDADAVAVVRDVYVLDRWVRLREGSSLGIPVDERLEDGLAAAMAG